MIKKLLKLQAGRNIFLSPINLNTLYNYNYSYYTNNQEIIAWLISKS